MITGKTIIRDILEININAAEILMRHGMGCIGCPSSQGESLEEAAAGHGIDINELLAALNEGIAEKAKAEGMFCYQCEQTVGGKGCVKVGVCGKDATTAALQDLLIYQLKGIGFYAQKAIDNGIQINDRVNKYTVDGMFSTLTNVNFDSEKFMQIILEGNEIKAEVKKLAGDFAGQAPKEALFRAKDDLKAMLEVAREVGVMADKAEVEDIRSLKELAIYGLKGVAAYAYHAKVLGRQEKEVNDFFYKLLSSSTDKSLTVNDWINLNMELGKVNFKNMEMLDSANTGTYGNPVPTPVLITKKKGPFIVVSGHDLKDLAELLEQTEGKGINIFTHGEMLPCHGYPELKKYSHLVGNYGGAWQDQQKEFDNIPGAILMTTNCIQKPKESYKDRIYTSGVVFWPDTIHIEEVEGKKDFTQIIEKALELGGWAEDEEEKSITVGFGHNATLSHAAEIIDAVKSGAIKHFFLIGGCDGAKSGRNYYTEMATTLPKNTVIMTLACGKYRFNKLDLGTVAGLPRLLDVGQCNDAYSAIKIALALAEAFECTVNDLPLSMILSWYEQKAVCILLTLLSLGVKGIRLGPTLPAFISPNVLQVLVDNFDIKPITNAENDIKDILG